MHPPTRARPWIPAALLLLPAAACRSLDAAEETARRRAAATPTLEEIFLLPGIQGRPPRLESVSADGKWVFFRHNPLKTSADGQRQIAASRSLRVQSTLAPESTDYQGLPLAELLPKQALEAGEKPAEEPADPQISLSHHGARVLARRGSELFLLDPPSSPHGRWSVRSLLHGEKDGPFAKLESARFSEDDDAVLLEAGADLWSFPLAGESPSAAAFSADTGTNLTATIESDAGRLSFSRDRKVVFSREAVLAAALEAAQAESSESPQPKAQVLWLETGRAVELAGMAEIKNVEDSELSPDGKWVFAAAVDRSKDPAPTLIPDYLSARVSTRDGRRDLADESPAPRKLHVWDTTNGESQPLLLDGGEVFWMRTSSWAPQPDAASPARLALARLSEDFRTLETYLWSPEGGLQRVLLDRDERWIGGPIGGPRWGSDGKQLIFGSESFAASSTPGKAQLFAFDVESGRVRQLTEVSGEVSAFDVAPDGGIVFSYSEDRRRDRRRLAYVDAQGAIRQLAAPEGFNAQPRLADRSLRTVFLHGSMFQPDELWSLDAGSDQPALQLTRGAPAEFLRRDWIRPVRFEVVGEREARVASHVFLPRESSLEHPDRPRPCVVFIHGAGYLQNVADSMTEYEPNLMFHSRLAGMGYVVLDVDYRGSSGYGQDFRSAAQYNLGELELSDIHRTLDALAARGVIDPRRAACYGGSYGGFLTLMALFTAGDRWCAGAALRSVTDWRTYHPGYTQPRLGRPSTHPEAYARSSPIDHAEKLNKPLLLLHGMMDSNVFAQDTIRLMEKLIDEGKDFEVMLYPSQNHAFTDGAHWLDEYKRIEAFLMEHLGLP